MNIWHKLFEKYLSSRQEYIKNLVAYSISNLSEQGNAAKKQT